MRRLPTTTGYRPPGPKAFVGRTPARRTYDPQSDASAVQSFLASGGATSFFNATDFAPAPDGVQLVAHHFVPEGRVGFLKQIRVAPYCPPQLAIPWQGWPGNWPTFEAFAPFGTTRAPAQNGVWTTPFGWESYFDDTEEALRVPAWQWWVTLMQGTISQARGVRGPFDVTDPATWWLTPNIPVPASVYGTLGVPGSTPVGMEPQRMQVLQADELDLHLVLPPNTTLLLWCRWNQLLYQPLTMDASGVPADVGDPLYVLLPAFGQLLGYTQAVSGSAAQRNAREGWGG